MLTRTTREEELQIEVERLKAWLEFIANEAWKSEKPDLETFARTAIKYSSCVIHPDWEHTEGWAKLGVWPRKLPGMPTGPRPLTNPTDEECLDASN